MAQNKIILYYQFAPIADPQAVMLWQRALCEKLGLRGRILISKHGINGTLGGEINAVKAYTKETRKYPGFKNMEFKWSEGGAEDFPPPVREGTRRDCGFRCSRRAAGG